MILRRWNLRALRPDPRRIHGDPWPSTPFSHFRGNVRGKRWRRGGEREKKGRIISPSHIHPIDDLSFISIKNLRAEIRFDDHDALLDRSSKGKKERKKKASFQKNSHSLENEEKRGNCTLHRISPFRCFPFLVLVLPEYGPTYIYI